MPMMNAIVGDPASVVSARGLVLLCYGLHLSLLIGCGSSPQPSERSPVRSGEVVIGPLYVLSEERVKSAEESLASMIDHARSRQVESNTRGVNIDQARALVIEGRSLMKENKLNAALERYEHAQKIYPDEDHLLLIAATRHLLYKRNHEADDCHQALLDWQQYLQRCERCQSMSRHRDRVVVNTNALGAQCGAWTMWESDPLRALLTIDDVSIGRTPLNIWLPTGKHRYELKRAGLADHGELNLEVGQQRQLRPTLVREREKSTYSIEAQLKCMPSKSGKRQVKRCANSLKSGDLFTVELVSNQDVFVYLFALSDGELQRIYPLRGSGGILADRPIILPQNKAWLVNDQSMKDELWLLASGSALSSFQSVTSDSSSALTEVRSIAGHVKSLGDKDRVTARSAKGLAFIRWVIQGDRPQTLILSLGDRN